MPPLLMLSPKQNAQVVRYLRTHSKYPLIAISLWALCLNHLHHETGEILLTRDELADKMAIRADHVSTIMSELEAFGAIIRHRQKIAGMKGRGVVRYFMNPNVATYLSGVQRDIAQREAPSLGTPLLKVIQGGMDAGSPAVDP